MSNVAVTRQPAPFQPLKIELVLETPEQVQAFYAVCNFSRAIGSFVAERTAEEKRVPISPYSVNAVLYPVWQAMHEAGIHSGAENPVAS